MARGTLSRLTTYSGQDQAPLWTIDGQHVVFGSDREGQDGLFWKAWNGTGDVERLVTREPTGGVWPSAWSQDGSRLVFTESSAGSLDIGVLPMDGDRAAKVLIKTEFNEGYPTISPDGGWIAYESDTSGQFEVYVQRFPNLGDRLLVSTGGGIQPLWSPDGRELFYRSPDGRRVLAVPVETGRGFSAGTPAMLFEGSYFQRGGYDVAPNGHRFVIVKQGDAPEIILVENWFEEFKQRVPVP